jgi:hypothetical protein
MRSILTTLALFVIALPAAAQQQPAPPTAVALAEGWHGRVDRANQNIAEVQFAKMGDGFHVKTGPHVILWNAANTATGTYRASASFTQSTAPERLEGYGLLVGGRDLDKPTQDYLYFLIRHDGNFMIRHRAGEEVHTLMDWTASDAIVKPGAGTAATNTLDIEALPQQVRFLINGKEVHVLERVPMLNTEGIAGLRVGHHLDVHVGSFTIQPIAK